MRDLPGRVEDFTTPALVMGGLNLFLWMLVVWGSFGYPAALLFAALVHALIARLFR